MFTWTVGGQAFMRKQTEMSVNLLTEPKPRVT